MSQVNFPSVDRILDARGDIRDCTDQALLDLYLHGHIHITNTGLNGVDDLLSIFPQLGLLDEYAFQIGGRTTGSFQEKWIKEPILRNMDFYPPSKRLLPNTEVQYMHQCPNYVLLYVNNPGSSANKADGCIYLHSVKEIEHRLAQSEIGANILQKVKDHGLKIVTGYVSLIHPDRHVNYMKSWQEITGADDIQEAVQIMAANTMSYSKVWVQDEAITQDQLQQHHQPNGEDSGKSIKVENVHTIMTEIIISGFRGYQDDIYLNLPRIADKTAPAAFINGYRRFGYGNDEAFTDEENQCLLSAYDASKIGSEMKKGDIYLFDNVRVGHSRDPFCDLDPNNKRSVFVAMNRTYKSVNAPQFDGVQLEPLLPTGGVKFNFLQQNNDLSSQQSNTQNENNNNDSNMSQLEQSQVEEPQQTPPQRTESRYITPPVETQIKDRLSMVVYDLNGVSLQDAAADLLDKYKFHGLLHITDSQRDYTTDPSIFQQPVEQTALDQLGFAVDEQFKWGGKSSGRTIRFPKGNGFYSVDKYPAELTLLPHQEIFYQRLLPMNMMFHYRLTSGSGNGGRTFAHSGLHLEKLLKAKGEVGLQLIKRLRSCGQSIETGFLDQDHPMKELNFVRSWQDRFGTSNESEALKTCAGQKTHFDDCWFVNADTNERVEATASGRGDETNDMNGERMKKMLMTKITIPVFKQFEGQSYMMFPRIAYDVPSLINGFRRFPQGNDQEFTDDEIQILLEAYWNTRQGCYQNPGDILLLNNIKFGHSREPYRVKDENGNTIVRDAALIMSGEFQTDPME